MFFFVSFDEEGEMRLAAKRRKYEAAMRRRLRGMCLNGCFCGGLLALIAMFPPLMTWLSLLLLVPLLWVGWHGVWYGYNRSRLRQCPGIIGVRMVNGTDSRSYVVIEPKRRRRMKKVLPFTRSLAQVQRVVGGNFVPQTEYAYELATNDITLALGSYSLRLRLELSLDTKPAALARSCPDPTPERFQQWVQLQLHNHFARRINSWTNTVSVRLKKMIEEMHRRKHWTVGSCRFTVAPLLLKEGRTEVWDAKKVVVLDSMPVNGNGHANGHQRKRTPLDSQLREILLKHGYQPPKDAGDHSRYDDVFID